MKVILASAGTGKTHALLEIFKERVQKGLPPYRVALVTFSRRAAEELLVRVEEEGLPMPFVGTIHSFLCTLLTLAAPLTGRPVPEPVDEFEAELVFSEEAKSLLLEKGQELDPGRAQGAYLGHAQGAYLGHAQGAYLEDLLHLFRKRAYAWPLSPKDGEVQDLLSLFHSALERYRQRMGRRMGPADLELEALKILRNRKVAECLSRRFPLILVDEFQDTSPIQAKLFRALEVASPSGEHQEAGSEVVAVGDSKQSVYAFRNADVEAFRQAVREGEVLKKLDVTYRHPEALAAFLNELTGHLFQKEGPDREHFPVRTEKEGGRVEVLWVTGETDPDADLDDLRAEEARRLVKRLREIQNEDGIPFSHMAVLFRSRTSLPYLEEAFQREKVPYVLVKGRGFFQRPEVRAVYRALSYAAKGEGLFPLLIGPYFGLSAKEAKEVLEGKGELPELQDLLNLAQLPPLEALKRVVKTPAFRKRLDGRARQNLDALLVQAGARNFHSLEALLLWLARGVEDPEAGEVPEGGEGVQLMTIHAAKGLEFPLVALFDVSRGEPLERPRLYVGRSGQVARQDRALEEEEQKKREDEAKRLLYVALSRAKEVLLISGSHRKELSPWGKVLDKLGYGPYRQKAKSISYAPGQKKAPSSRKPTPSLGHAQGAYLGHAQGAYLEEAPYTGQVFAPPKRPLLQAPSRALAEPDSPAASLGEHREVPAWPRAVGILTHWAIAQGLHPDSPGTRDALLSQEVALLFKEEEREILWEEVLGLLRAYHELMEGGAIPPLDQRDEDHAELPLLLQEGETTWVGVADRVYRVGEVWYLEDYKTDQEPSEERLGHAQRAYLAEYRFQLEVYRKALEGAWGIKPRVRLVFLRSGEVVEFEPDGAV